MTGCVPGLPLRWPVGFPWDLVVSRVCPAHPSSASGSTPRVRLPAKHCSCCWYARRCGLASHAPAI